MTEENENFRTCCPYCLESPGEACCMRCPTYEKFGACSCSTGVLGPSRPNTYVGSPREALEGGQ